MTAEANGALVEVSACPSCGSERFSVSFEEPPYSVRRCESCGLVWVSPRLTQEALVGIYTDDNYWRSDSPKTVGYASYRDDEPLYLKTFRRRLGFALRNGPRGGRALDVGCAAGFCMKVLDELGFEVHGVEPSAEIARHAIDHFGFDTVHIGTLDTAAHTPGSFDLITMWDVIEHVVDPRSLLEQARELLKPDGLLVIETQNVNSAFARLLGPRWHHYKHSEHVYHFSPTTVDALLSSAGFRVEKLTPRFAGKYVSLDFIAERSARLHPAASKVLRPITRFKSAALYVNVMDEMIVIAKPGTKAPVARPQPALDTA